MLHVKNISKLYLVSILIDNNIKTKSINNVKEIQDNLIYI